MEYLVSEAEADKNRSVVVAVVQREEERTARKTKRNNHEIKIQVK